MSIVDKIDHAHRHAQARADRAAAVAVAAAFVDRVASQVDDRVQQAAVRVRAMIAAARSREARR